MPSSRNDIQPIHIYNGQFVAIQNKYCTHVTSGCLFDTHTHIYFKRFLNIGLAGARRSGGRNVLLLLLLLAEDERGGSK
jgi:hypothetical protein